MSNKNANIGARLDRLPNSGWHIKMWLVSAFALLVCWSNGIGGAVQNVLLNELHWLEPGSTLLAMWGTTYTAGQLFGALVGGPIGDKIGRKNDGFSIRLITGQISGGGFCFQHFHHLVSGGVGRPLLEKARHHKDCVAYPRFGHAVRAAGRAFVSLGVGHRQISFPASSRFSCSIFPCAAAFLKFSPVKQRGEHISSRRS